MTDQERLEAINQRAEAATAGPWSQKTNHEAAEDCGIRGGITHVSIMCGPDDPDDVMLYGQNAATEEDAEFIAHARDDIPWLIERLQEAEAELTKLRAVCEPLVDEGDVPPYDDGHGNTLIAFDLLNDLDRVLHPNRWIEPPEPS